MTVTINGTTGIANDGGYTGDGVVFADTTPANTLVTTTGGNVGIGTSSPTLNTTGTVLHINNSTASRAAIIHMTNAESGSASADGLICGKWSDGTNYFFDYDSNPIIFGTGGTNRAIIDTSGNFQFNSGYGSVATAYGCRAWVNFNGTGTVAIRASGNVSSITDNGVDDYTVNFATALVDANYCVGGSAKITSGSGGTGPANEPLTIGPYNLATGSFRIYTTYDSTVNDAQIACVDVHR